MKLLRISTFFVCMMVVLLGANSFAQNMGSGTVSGIVKSDVDKLPIFNATVFALSVDNPFMPKKYHAKTDSNGSYNLKSLANGKYRVFASADSFVSEFYDNTRNPLEAKILTIANGTTIKDVNFFLKIGGIISGTVVDSTGKGIPNALVAATLFDSGIFPPQPAWMDSLLMWDMAYTDKAGKYQITTLDSGKYRVMAKLTAAPNLFFQFKFWENTTDPSSAKPVLVDNGKVTPNINFQFDIGLPKGGIAGKVKDANGNPLKGIYLFAWKKSNSDSFYSNFKGFQNLEKTDENGNYQIESLTPGDYYVSATRMEWWSYQTIWYDGVSAMENATPVAVADTITKNINFVFDKAKDLGSISGKVISEVDGAPISEAYVEAMWIGSYVGTGNMRFRPSLFAWTNQNGEYKIDLVQEGKYIVLVHKNGYTEFYDNTKDIEKATEVEVKSGQETKGINFAIPPMLAGSKVSGIVTDDSTGAPVQGAFVTLFPVMDSPYGGAFAGKFTLFDFYATISNAKGEYIIGGIPKGKYIAVCWGQNYIVEFYNDKLAPWDADNIELDGTAEKSGINFALTRGWGFKFQGPGNEMNLGAISGQVTDNQGRFIDGAYVSVIDENRQVRASERTGPDGRYTLGGIPVGDYYIKVDRMPYRSTYFGNAAEINNATPITVGQAGNFSITNANVELTPMSASSIGDENKTTGLPDRFELSQNYPNPFNPSTAIRYALPQASPVTLKIFNLQGELVKTLVNGYQTANHYQVVWNGENESGAKVAAGIYLYQLKTDNYSQIKRMIFIK